MNKIIILTPIKNEEFILNQFLQISSLIADCIIIIDQNSDDKSVEICNNFPKVHLIHNYNNYYDEAWRQELLIETARKLFPNDNRIIFCIDADEIFTSESYLNYKAWDNIKTLSPGTAIYLEKPDLLPGINSCIRWHNNYFPIGFIDDNSPHNGTKIHSQRFPSLGIDKHVYINEIKLMHFAHSRPNVQSAKFRFYSVIENIHKTKPIYLRRFAYQSFFNDKKFNKDKSIEKVPESWLSTWDSLYINLREISDIEYSWHDFDVLKKFKNYGTARFYFDNIWNFDWEKCRKYALIIGKEAPSYPIAKPPFFYIIFGRLIDLLYIIFNVIRNFRNA